MVTLYMEGDKMGLPDAYRYAPNSVVKPKLHYEQ